MLILVNMSSVRRGSWSNFAVINEDISRRNLKKKTIKDYIVLNSGKHAACLYIPNVY